jgi:hypothetical protein
MEGFFWLIPWQDFAGLLALIVAYVLLIVWIWRQE